MPTNVPDSSLESTFACHSVWIGPNKLPIQAVLNLYDKARLYTKEHHAQNGFIPVLCLNKDSASQLDSSFVPVELITITQCPDDHIRQAAGKLRNCTRMLKIDPDNGENIGYIQVLLWEELHESISQKIASTNLNDKILQTADFIGELIKPEDRKKYFIEDMPEYLIKTVVGLLCEKKAYVAASDIVRLLLLAIQPGCYSDISDIKLKRLPYKSDFECSFLTRRNENDLIISLDTKDIIHIIMAMYVRIRQHIEKHPIPNNIPDIIQLLKERITFFAENLEDFSKLFMKSSKFFIDPDLPLIGEYVRTQECFVNRVAGFHFWSNPVGRLCCQYGYQHIRSDGSFPSVPEEVFPASKLRISEFSWNTPGVSFMDKLSFLGGLLSNSKLRTIVKKEVDDISKQYSLSITSVIEMSMLAVTLRSETKKEEELPQLIEQIKQNATHIVQELESVTERVKPIIFSEAPTRLRDEPDETTVQQDSKNKLKVT